MAIVIEAHSVVLRVSTITSKYPGGMEAFARDCPNRTFCADDDLCRVAFMAMSDAELFVANLVTKGITPSKISEAGDAVIIGATRGPLQPCSWVELGQWNDTVIAWRAGTVPSNVCAPEGWKPESKLLQMSPEEMKENLEFVRTENNVDVYRDKRTGKELYTARTDPLRKLDESKHDELYRKAQELIEGLLHYDDKPPAVITPERRKRLDQAIELFKEVIEINPGNWAAMWLLGKVFQRLEQFDTGLQWFARAHKVKPDQPDVAREAAIAAMNAGRPAEAVGFCERAIAASPDDAGLRANLALALLFSEKPKESLEIGKDALRRNPEDRITATIVKITEEVLRGSRPCPHHMRDINGIPPVNPKPWWKFWG